MARLSILSSDEINALYVIPSLNNEERHWLFELDDDDIAYINSFDDVGRKINYILQLGFYKAASYFFRFTFQQVKADVYFILALYFPELPFPKSRLSKDHHYKNRVQVCKKLCLKDADASFFLQLEKEARRLTKIHVLPKFILTGLLSFCQQKEVIKPAYSTLQDFISKALKLERVRLTNKLYTEATVSVRKQLDNLLSMDDLFYNLTLIKKDQKDFTTTEILNTVKKQKLIISLYRESQELIKNLGLSEQNTIYYADLTEYYTIQNLRIFSSKNLSRLYILCYVHRRLRKINDHLTASFIQKILTYIKLGDDYQKKQVDTVEAVDKQLRSKAYNVMLVNVNRKIPDHLVRNKVFDIVPEDEYSRFLSDFKKPNLDRDFHRWLRYKQLGQTFKRNLRPVFKAISFSCDNDELKKALQFLQQHIDGKRNFKEYSFDDIPMNFFPKSLKRFLFEPNSAEDKSTKDKIIDGDRYEFMVYWQLQKGLSDISVYIRESSEYRALEDELVDIEYWETHKHMMQEQLNMPLLTTNIVDILATFENNIENKYKVVNERINNGKNTSIKLQINRRGEVTHWTLPYTPLDNGTNNPFFKKLQTKNIGSIARFVDSVTDYGKAFTHIQPKNTKIQPEMEIIDACVIANATGTDLSKMADISDVNEQALKRTNKSFLRVQTLSMASEIIVNNTEKLPIFKEYNLSDYGVHASIDGQKFATKFNTIKSRYAKKYFGLKKGVVLMTLSANHLPICLKVIGANEHESHYLLDLVESNTSDVEVKSVSGDMHSINRVNFALMHMFGYRFMPRYTQLADKSKHKLVCFGTVSDYEDLIIKPSKKAKNILIINEWDKVSRILVSLAMKKTTQANVVRKLSTSKALNPTLKALIAFDEIEVRPVKVLNLATRHILL